MPTTPRDLLKGLLEYIEEQAKNIDPKGYHLSVAPFSCINKSGFQLKLSPILSTGWGPFY